jgi:hypothetical protein
LAYFPPALLKCVVFLGYKNSVGKYHFAGSAFWISRKGPDDIKEEYRPAYLVTAAHVIEKIQKESSDGRVWMRINTKSGNQDWRETPLPFWKTHSDPAVDIAVLKVGIDSDYDHVAWPLEALVIHDQLDTIETGDRRIELGDEICFAGLFHPHAGQKKNVPIVRIGTVAALRDEPVTNRDNRAMDAYLVESQSIGGLSGSPVFIDIITAKTVLPPSAGYMAGAYDPKSPLRFKLLGLIHGHFGSDIEPDSVVDDGKEKLHINTGIAMVIPAEKILEILTGYMNEEVIEADDIRKKKLAPTVPVNIQVGDASQHQPNGTFGITTLKSTDRKKD